MLQLNKDELRLLWEDTARILVDLDQYFSGRGPVPVMRAPAGEAELEALERHLDLRLPPSYRAFLGLYDGVENFVHRAALLSIGEIIANDPGEALAEIVAEIDPELTRFIFAGGEFALDVFCFDWRTVRDDGEMDVVRISIYGEEERSDDFSTFLKGYHDASLAALENERKDREHLE